jgi:hypothetical protein
MEKKFKEIYYKPENLWKGHAAIDKLANVTKSTKKEAKQWLEKQTIWQIYLKPPKHIQRRSITCSKPNEIHQMDLLFLPNDKVGKKTYKYALTVIDVASRYKQVAPLTTKNSDEIAKSIEKIYKNSDLTYPTILQVDDGREFYGHVIALMKKHGTEIRRIPPRDHRAQSLVERFNRTLGEQLFTNQYAKEILAFARAQDDDEALAEVRLTSILSKPAGSVYRNTEWVKNLPRIVNSLNNTVTRMINMKPIDAIKLQEIVSKTANVTVSKRLELGPNEKVRYLYNAGELENGQKRATDPIWSLEMFDIVTASEHNGQYAYQLENIKNRSFIRDELLVVPADSELPN